MVNLTGMIGTDIAIEPESDDNINMIGDTSSLQLLASLGSNFQSTPVAQQIQMSVIKQQQDIQETQAQALISMINNAPSPDAAIGRNLDISV